VREDTGESSKHNNLRTAGDRNNLRPSRTAVRDGEGVAVVSCFLPSIMTHEVHLHVPGDSSREFPGRDDGNESQQTPWFCSGSMPPVPPLAFSSLSRRSVPIPEVGNPGKGREDQCILLLCAGKHVPQRLSVCHTSLPRALLSLASFCPRCEVFFNTRGASHEPKDVFVSEGVLHVSVMGVALCRAGGNPFCLPLPPPWICVNNIVLKLPRRCCTAECECAMVDRTETGAKIIFST